MGRRSRAAKAKVVDEPPPPRGLAARLGSLLDPGARPSIDRTADRTAGLILALVLCAILLPFIGVAFHIDDPLFIWAAQHIRQHPTNPYGFTVNWYGFDMAMSDVTKNPPFTSYYITLVASVVGWSELALHAAFLVPALAVAIGAYLIAGRMCSHPLVAAIVALLTPAFLLSSLTVMSDVMMLAFWVFAVHAWMKGVESGRHGWFLLAALLIAASAFSKYYGATLIPLLLVYSVVKERRGRAWMLYLLIPAAILAWYQWITGRLYGHGLLFDAASYATQRGHSLGRFSLAKTLATVAFTGGCLASVLFFSRRLWSWRALLAGFGLAILAALVAQTWSRLGSFEFPVAEGAHWVLSIQFGIWAALGLSLACLAMSDLWRSRDAESVLLFLWIAGTFIFAGFVNWSTNGRSILPMVVPIGILVVRRLELNASRRAAVSARSPILPLAAAAVLSILVLRADYTLAETARTGAALIRARHSPAGHTTWFEGHWGFQYYMERVGAKPIEQKSRYTPGDVIAIPTTNTGLLAMPAEWTAATGVVDVQPSPWLSTMNSSVGAGFYADVFGPLPFAFGAVPSERFTILTVK